MRYNRIFKYFSAPTDPAGVANGKKHEQKCPKIASPLVSRSTGGLSRKIQHKRLQKRLPLLNPILKPLGRRHCFPRHRRNPSSNPLSRRSLLPQPTTKHRPLHPINLSALFDLVKNHNLQPSHVVLPRLIALPWDGRSKLAIFATIESVVACHQRVHHTPASEFTCFFAVFFRASSSCWR
jgi:hypothetical protein